MLIESDADNSVVVVFGGKNSASGSSDGALRHVPCGGPEELHSI
jgi:hypothetical protein